MRYTGIDINYATYLRRITHTHVKGMREREKPQNITNVGNGRSIKSVTTTMMKMIVCSDCEK